MTQLTALAKPFAPHLIHPPAKGKYGDYVNHAIVTEKLLAVVGPFNFSVGELIRDHQGYVVGCYGTLNVTVDGVEVTVTEVGSFDGSEKENDGERVKKAASDAIKRCAMRIGVGLHLWAGDDSFLHSYLMTTNRTENE